MAQHRSPPAMSGIAQIVRESRDARAWSQMDLAHRAGVSRPSIARIESGENVSTATLAKVTQALGLVLEVRTDVTAQR